MNSDIQRKAQQRDEIVERCRIFLDIYSKDARNDGLACQQYYGYIAHQHYAILEMAGESDGLVCPCDICQRNVEIENCAAVGGGA